MAKITRLSDPSNPYGKKPTPTTAPSAADQARARAASQKASLASANAAMKPKPVPATSVMKQLNDQYMSARHRAIEKGVSGKK